MLSRDEAITFLRDVLHVDDAEIKLLSDKLELLKEITNKFQRHVPFQNVSLLSLDPEDRCIPPWEHIKRDALAGVGGMCYSMAVFARNLLTSLGFESFLIACTIPHTGRCNTHISAVAQNVQKQGDCYLIELGAGFPSFEPVPLHDLPREYQHVFLNYKFVRDGNVVSRCHKSSRHLGQLPSNVDADGWQKFYEFEVTPHDEDSVRAYQQAVYTQPGFGASWYLMGVKMSIYPENRAVTVSDNTIKLWDGTTKELQTVVLKTDEELEKEIRRYFPMLQTVDVKKALKTRKTEKERHDLKTQV